MSMNSAEDEGKGERSRKSNSPLEPYHYRICGLSNVWLVNGFRQESTPDGSTVVIESVDGLHREIARTIVTDQWVIKPEELGFLRRFLAFSRASLAGLLGTTEQSVSRWEEGDTQIDPAGERLVRFIVLETLGDQVTVREVLSDLSTTKETSRNSSRRFILANGVWSVQ